jgi:3-methyl-2-oxobutanoate hydroxymethyltransferase
LTERVPKFARTYVNLRGEIAKAATAFAADVAAGTFPDEDHSYT